ncbi:MAG: GNAT family N-acetyltransferase [Acidimicrobiia bacterium]
MPDRLHLDGVWPGSVTVRRGWAKALARPWNDDFPDPAVRLERGTHEFLRAVAELLGSMGSGIVYSPALYPSATKVWITAGFAPFRLLDVMEMALGAGIGAPEHEVEATNVPDWDPLVAIDHLAFDGFWRMSEAGLVEAMRATPRATVLTARIESELAGYALVGSQMTVSYLQRVAVDPSFAGQGIGGSLVQASALWASKRGSRALVLNLRPENDRARRLYEREGFQARETPLHLLRYGA